MSIVVVMVYGCILVYLAFIWIISYDHILLHSIRLLSSV